MELRPDEHALYEGRPSWRALMSFYVAGLLTAVVAVVVIAVLISAVATGIVVGVVLAAGTLVIGYLRRLFTRYLITDQRLRISRGLIRRHVQEARLDRVQNVNYDQGFIDRVFNVGTVDFDTAGTDDADFRFAWVDEPESVVRAVHEAQAESTASASH